MCGILKDDDKDDMGCILEAYILKADVVCFHLAVFIGLQSELTLFLSCYVVLSCICKSVGSLLFGVPLINTKAGF